MAIAFSLEGHFTKDELLTAYLNHIYLGQHAGVAIHGFGRAAQVYFNKDVAQLSLGESALLVGIIRGPNVFSPRRHPERARVRRDLVLRQMLGEGEISESLYEEELTRELNIWQVATAPVDARWYLDYVNARLTPEVQRLASEGAGLRW